MLCLNVQADTERLRIAAIDAPPYIYNDNGQAKGILVDKLNAVSAQANLTYSIVFMPWVRAIRELYVGDVDVVMPVVKTPSREKFLRYAKYPLFSTDVALVSAVGAQVEYNGDISSLYGSTFAVVRGVSVGEQIDNLFLQGTITRVTVNDVPSAIKMIAAKRVDYIALPYVMARHYQSQINANIEVSKIPVANLAVYSAFSKDSKVPEELQRRWLEADHFLRERGEMDITEKNL
jgi:polar amino acid transport system substrate-binding protein